MSRCCHGNAAAARGREQEVQVESAAPRAAQARLGGGARETERRDGEISLYDLPYYFTYLDFRPVLIVRFTDEG